MEFAAGVLGWNEPTFWSCSLRFYERAVIGYRKANGIAIKGMSRSRLAELKSLYPDD